MNLSNLPSVDDAWAYILHLSRLPAAIVVLLLLVRTLYGWYGAIDATARRGRAFGYAIRRVFARMRTMPRVAIGVSIVAFLLTLAAQGIWLVFNFLIGNVLSGALGVNRALHGLNENIVPTWAQFSMSLHWDAVSAGYVLMSTAGLMRAYILAARRTPANGWGNFFAVPGYIYGFCGLFGGSLYILLNILGHFSHSDRAVSWSLALFIFGAGVIGSLYVFACRMVFRAPLLVLEMWSDRPKTYVAGTRRSSLS
jgi:hypothetical protein